MYQQHSTVFPVQPIRRALSLSLIVSATVTLALAQGWAPVWAQYQPYNNYNGYNNNGYGGGYNGYNEYNGGYGSPPPAYGSRQQPSRNYGPPPGYTSAPPQPSYNSAPPQSSYTSAPPASYNNQPYAPYNAASQPPATSDADNADDGSGNIDEYAKYSDEGSRLFDSGQLTQSIAAFEKALSVAPNSSLPVVYNNLAVVYIKRGNYFHDKLRQDENALNDFRKAYFYLDSAWPEGMERKSLHEKNREVTRENLNIAYRNLGINASDKNKHLELAKQLRMQGKFPEAIVEYQMALELDKKDPVAAKALGDLFTVVNMPEKSKKYYGIAVGGSDLPTMANTSAGAAAPASGSAYAGTKDDTLVQLGNAQYKTGEVDKAIANFDKALAIDPTNVSALNMLEKIWKDELKFNPTSVVAHANLGSVYQKRQQYDNALAQYNAAEHFAEQDPKTPFDVKKQIRLNIGTLFQAQKRYDLAQKAYDTILQVEPNHLQANLYKASLLEDTGNTDGALQTYNKILSIDPNNKTAQDKLLGLAKQQSDPAKAAAGLKQYADRFPNNATVQEQIGEEFHQRKDLANAAYYYNRAIQLDPKMANAWGNLGAVYQAQGKDEDSAQAYQKAQALDPTNKTFQELSKSAASDIGYKSYQQAVTLQQQGKTQESLSYFQKALVTNDTGEVHAAYGVALQTTGQLDSAIAEYQKAIAKEPSNPDYVYSLGTAYQQKKDPVKAKAAYQKALALKPDYADAKNALASFDVEAASATLDKAIDAYNAQNYTSALTLVNESLAKNTNDPMAHYYKGLILDGLKKPTLAAQSYRTAIQYKSDFNDAYYALGVALDNAKDTQGARTAFEKFLELSGSNEDDFVKYARDRVKTLAAQH